MLDKLMPKGDAFFDDFDRQAAAAVEGTKLLHALLNDFTDVESKAAKIKDVEHQGDAHTKAAFNRLHQQFLTPFDRAEIHRLLGRIDGVLDLSDAAASRLALYEVKEIPEEARKLGEVLVHSAEQMQKAVNGLRNVKKSEPILAACSEIGRLEKEGDQCLRRALGQLFKSGQDPLTVMKWKEIYELLEGATDRCEDVANVIQGVVLEHA